MLFRGRRRGGRGVEGAVGEGLVVVVVGVEVGIGALFGSAGAWDGVERGRCLVEFGGVVAAVVVGVVERGEGGREEGRMEGGFELKTEEAVEVA